MKTTLTPIRVLHLSARLMSILLFLLWGSIFVEHLGWFFPPMPLPPFYVWAGQSIHLGLLIGYLLVFWNEKSGSLVITAFSFAFFFFIVGNASAIVFFLLSSLPAGFLAICWRLEKKGNDKTSQPEPRAKE